VGRTPLAGPLTLPAGEHEFGFERPGYVPHRGTFTIPEQAAASADERRPDRAIELVGPIRSFDALEQLATEKSIESIDCALKPESPLSESVAAQLVVDTGEQKTTVLLDGAPLPEEGRIPMGRHYLEVSQTGFSVYRRELSLKAGETRTLEVRLIPDDGPSDGGGTGPLSQRAWAYMVGGGGLLVSAGAVALYVWNDSRFDEWESEQDALDVAVLEQTPHPPEIGERQSENDDLLDSIHLWDAVTLGTALAGGALIATGAILYLTAEEPPPEGETARVHLVASAGGDRGTIGWKVRW
jgi:hypothetical protein